MAPALRVLVVEDNADLAEMIGDFLMGRGHRVDFAADGVAGLRLAAAGGHDAVVLDRTLPKLDGASACRRLREEHGNPVPVLMLTAMDSVEDKVTGLAAGADDYLVKPFQLAELEARLLALHRRASGAVAPHALRVDGLEYDPDTCVARRDGRPLALSPTCRKLLEHLMRQTHRIVPREELEHLLWGEDVPDRDVLRAHMHNLRDAVDREFEVKLLRTYRGTGYRLAAAA